MTLVLIPTHDRLTFWRDHRKLLDGLYRQSDPDFECIIVDDHSTDGTMDWLVSQFRTNPPPFRFKLIQSRRRRKREFQTSASVDNIGFREATGDTILHLDDDLAIGPKIVACAKEFNVLNGKRIIWGALTFSDENWGQRRGPTGMDRRWLRARSYGCTDGRLSKTWRGAWGAVYVVATSVVRAIGGHSLSYIGYRGADARLGNRIVRHGAVSWLSTDPRIVTMHYGRSWFQRQVCGGRGYVPAGTFRSPHVNLIQRALPVVVNGGRKFWTSSWFDGAYDIVLHSEDYA